jgi:hypothetical protein
MASQPPLQILLNETELPADFDPWNFRMPVQSTFLHLEESRSFFDR